jgi:hypothetical protein
LEGYFKQNSKARHLPLIVHVVIYHGSQKWHVENSLLPLFDTASGTECSPARFCYLPVYNLAWFILHTVLRHSPEVVAFEKRQVEAGGHELTGGLALHPASGECPSRNVNFRLALLGACFRLGIFIPAPSIPQAVRTTGCGFFTL